LYYLLLTIYIISCFVLILFVLLQPGKSDASQVFGGGANSAAFGPRGTQTVLAKITITAAIIFFLTAFLFSIPGLFERKSVGESVPVEQTEPPPPVTTPPASEAPAPPVTTQPATTTDANSNKAAGTKADDKNKNSGAKKPDQKK
jgi:preprotein translocase subunit SecG